MPSIPKAPDFADMLELLAILPEDDADMPDNNGKKKYDSLVDRTERLYLRIPQYDKDMLKDFGRSMGLPYQTLANAIIRYYIQAQLRK